MKYKMLILAFFLAIGCAHREPVIVTKKILDNLDGKMFFDTHGNGVFVPNNRFHKDIVPLHYQIERDSIEIRSTYDDTNFNAKYTYKGIKTSRDSVIVQVRLPNNYPLGFFVSIYFYEDQGIEHKYNILDTITSLPFDTNITSFQLSYMGATSPVFYSNYKAMRDTLLIEVDYLRPREVERYTFVKISIPR